MEPERAVDHIDLEEVRQRLALGTEERGWLAGLNDQHPTEGSEVILPVRPELSEILGRLGFAAEDAAVVIEAAPDQGWDPALIWLFEHCARRVIAGVGRWGADVGPWSELPALLGPRGRCFWIYVFLAALPAVRRWHDREGVPDDVSWATLADLGRHARRFRRRRGATGLGRDSLHWLSLHFTGGLFALGRLQFNPYRVERALVSTPRGEQDRCDPVRGPGAPVLGVHIPEAGPLSPDGCEVSYRWARRFFADLFPEHPAEIGICSSWLLDDQLAEYLPSTSNILRFQRRFQLLQEAQETNRDIVQFVFHRPPSALEELRPETTLERAIVAHIRAGRTWRVRTGWLRLPA